MKREKLPVGVRLYKMAYQIEKFVIVMLFYDYIITALLKAKVHCTVKTIYSTN